MVRIQAHGMDFRPPPGDLKFRFAGFTRLTPTINWLANAFTTTGPRYLYSLASFVSRPAGSAEWPWRSIIRSQSVGLF